MPAKRHMSRTLVLLLAAFLPACAEQTAPKDFADWCATCIASREGDVAERSHHPNPHPGMLPPARLGFPGSPDRDARNDAATAALTRKITLNLQNKSPQEALAAFRTAIGLNFFIRESDVSQANSTPVTIDLADVPAQTALDLLVEQFATVDRSDTPAWAVRDGVVIISSAQDLGETWLYDVRWFHRRPIEFESVSERVDRLGEIIRSAVKPQSWKANGGGTGSIQYADGFLMIFHTREVHARINELLMILRQRHE